MFAQAGEPPVEYQDGLLLDLGELGEVGLGDDELPGELPVCAQAGDP